MQLVVTRPAIRGQLTPAFGAEVTVAAMVEMAMFEGPFPVANEASRRAAGAGNPVLEPADSVGEPFVTLHPVRVSAAHLQATS